jgi:beta-galactosidase
MQKNTYWRQNISVKLLYPLTFPAETMRYLLITFFFLGCLSLAAQVELARENLLNDGWRFCRDDKQSAQKTDFDDSDWRIVDLPHDWSIEDLPGTQSPFHPDAISQVSGGFTTGGTAWYRKHFFIPADLTRQRFIIQFDGVYMNAEVWLNGHLLGTNPYGYSTFWFDISNHINHGANNIVAVKVRNEGLNSRWYSGSGIYRHVWLKVFEPVHIDQWGTQIETTSLESGSAIVKIRTKVRSTQKGSAQIKLQTRISSPQGKEVAVAESAHVMQADTVFVFEQQFEISNPVLWSPDTPALYVANQDVYQDNELMDLTETTFGIRTISFDTENGFRLNGNPILLKGGCVHHDNGPLGAMAFDRADERRVELLKASGFNAIRCAHNPSGSAFLDACDRLGMLVINEAFDMWETGKNPFDYHLYFRDWWKKDIESMVLRDRNHPCIIMWSSGNEIPERGNERGVELSKMIADHIRSLDATRPVTSAVNSLHPDKDPYFATLDIAGYNYASGGDHLNKSVYAQDHERVPDRIIYQAESYPLEAFDAWMGVLDYPYVIGDFVWTAFDYIGEASIGWLGYYQKKEFYPWNLAWCGDIDICGWKRPQSFYRDVLWNENRISVFVKPPKPSFPENPERQSWSKWHWHDAVADWNWNGYEGTLLEVSVYSSYPEVELFLNGKSLGKKKTDRSVEFMARYMVPYKAGELKAVGLSDKGEAGVATLITAGDPVKIVAEADRDTITSGGQDLSYVTFELQDKNGIRHPKAENLLEFELDGPGEIIAVANANPVSVESYRLPQRKAWQGRCMVIIRSGKDTGNITLTARSAGLKPAIINIQSR